MQTRLWLKAAIVLTVIYCIPLLLMGILQVRSVANVGEIFLNFLSATVLIPAIALWVSLFVSEKVSKKLHSKGWYVVVVSLISLVIYVLVTFAIGSGSYYLFHAGASRFFRVEELFFLFANAFNIIVVLIVSTLMWLKIRKNSDILLNQPISTVPESHSKGSTLIKILGGAIIGYWVGAKIYFVLNDRHILGPDADLSPILFFLAGVIIGFIIFLISTYVIFKLSHKISKKIQNQIVLGIIILFVGCFIVYPPFAPVSANAYYTQKAISEKRQDTCRDTKNLKAENNCLLKVAQAANDIALCKALTDSSRLDSRLINECLRSVGALISDRKIVCDMYVPERFDCKADIFSDNTTYEYHGCANRDGCYVDAALSKKDKNYCDSIVNSIQKNECYFKYAIENGDASSCNKLEKNADKNYCLARVNKNISFCANITDKEKINPYNNWSTSDVFSGVYFSNPRDLCIFDVAVVNKDRMMCDQISKPYNEQKLDKCYGVIEGDVDAYCSRNQNRGWDNCKSFMNNVIRSLKNQKY